MPLIGEFPMTPQLGGTIADYDLGMSSRYTRLIPGIGRHKPNALREGNPDEGFPRQEVVALHPEVVKLDI